MRAAPGRGAAGAAGAAAVAPPLGGPAVAVARPGSSRELVAARARAGVRVRELRQGPESLFWKSGWAWRGTGRSNTGGDVRVYEVACGDAAKCADA